MYISDILSLCVFRGLQVASGGGKKWILLQHLWSGSHVYGTANLLYRLVL